MRNTYIGTSVGVSNPPFDLTLIIFNMAFDCTASKKYTHQTLLLLTLRTGPKKIFFHSRAPLSGCDPGRLSDTERTGFDWGDFRSCFIYFFLKIPAV